MQNKHYVSHGVSEVYDLPKEKRSTTAELNVYLVTTFSFIVREPKAPESIQKDADTMQKNIQKNIQKNKQIFKLTGDKLRKIH